MNIFRKGLTIIRYSGIICYSRLINLVLLYKEESVYIIIIIIKVNSIGTDLRSKHNVTDWAIILIPTSDVYCVTKIHVFGRQSCEYVIIR
jgi:hypothetical protein